jgi:hypothetical protein
VTWDGLGPRETAHSSPSVQTDPKMGRVPVVEYGPTRTARLRPRGTPLAAFEQVTDVDGWPSEGVESVQHPLEHG